MRWRQSGRWVSEKEKRETERERVREGGAKNIILVFKKMQ